MEQFPQNDFRERGDGDYDPTIETANSSDYSAPIEVANDAEYDAPRAERPPLSEREKAEIFQTAIESGTNAALALIKERFEDTLETENRLEFHNTQHTEGVINRYGKIIDAIRGVDPSLISERTASIGRLAAAHHDTVQKWEPNLIHGVGPEEEGLFKIMRKRFAGDNEAESTEGALDIMNKVNEDAGTEIFSEEDKAIVRGGHEATIPGFNPEIGTVVQPKLMEESSLVERAIALADLGTAGMEGPEKFLPEGDALFREENLDIAEAVKNPSLLSDHQKNFYKKRMLGWSQFQSKFAAGRKQLLEDEIRPLPENVRNEVAKLFDKFDDSITAATEQAKKRESMTFEELAENMGYTLGTNDALVY